MKHVCTFFHLGPSLNVLRSASVAHVHLARGMNLNTWPLWLTSIIVAFSAWCPCTKTKSSRVMLPSNFALVIQHIAIGLAAALSCRLLLCRQQVSRGCPHTSQESMAWDSHHRLNSLGHSCDDSIAGCLAVSKAQQRACCMAAQVPQVSVRQPCSPFIAHPCT